MAGPVVNVTYTAQCYASATTRDQGNFKMTRTEQVALNKNVTATFVGGAAEQVVRAELSKLCQSLAASNALAPVEKHIKVVKLNAYFAANPWPAKYEIVTQ